MITSVTISCSTVSRKGVGGFQISTSWNDKNVYLSYGRQDKDIFIIDKKDFIDALRILGIVE